MNHVDRTEAVRASLTGCRTCAKPRRPPGLIIKPTHEVAAIARTTDNHDVLLACIRELEWRASR